MNAWDNQEQAVRFHNRSTMESEQKQLVRILGVRICS